MKILRPLREAVPLSGVFKVQVDWWRVAHRVLKIGIVMLFLGSRRSQLAAQTEGKMISASGCRAFLPTTMYWHWRALDSGLEALYPLALKAITQRDTAGDEYLDQSFSLHAVITETGLTFIVTSEAIGSFFCPEYLAPAFRELGAWFSCPHAAILFLGVRCRCPLRFWCDELSRSARWFDWAGERFPAHSFGDGRPTVPVGYG